MPEIFLSEWGTIASTVVKGLIIYVTLIVMLRISGKRSLSKFNIFDFIITIAIGSIFASTLTTQDLKLAQSVTAIVVLLGGQWLISRLAFRSDGFERLIKADPALLFFSGEYLLDTMRTERVTKREILQAVRNSGAASLDDVQAVILETDGTISVIAASGDAPPPQQNAVYETVKRNPEEGLA
ncbi:DUF421 domain-containing protein [Corynebacterium aquatimens]|uniref:DUF421 domain-containing protein n=1 Tax=Corynebacterium TaxID=1716 RepID=UPI001F2A01AE|nr:MULTISPECIES: YetF domain-containing protein [Corynebacterium]QYH19716.1 DUF421 domain-containing protein [Corynebacterium aquatimens]UIZ93187.1 DUF421 domain-containing protein [Corynebacterium sp. CNCTC7651]